MLNKVTLIGHIGQSPELRFTQSGRKVVTLSVATNADYKNKDGEWVKVTHWHRVKTWSQGLIDKVIMPHVHKGTFVAIDGTLEYENWTDKDDNKRQSAIVMIGPNGTFQILDKREKQEDQAQAAPASEDRVPETQVPEAQEHLEPEERDEEIAF